MLKEYNSFSIIAQFITARDLQAESYMLLINIGGLN